MKITTTNGNAFSTFSESARNVAASLVRRYTAATLAFSLQDREQCTAEDDVAFLLSFVAADTRDGGTLEHTGGNVWCGYSLHETIDGDALLAIVAHDSLEVSIARHRANVTESANARYDECGEDGGRVVVSLDVCDDGTDELTAASEAALRALQSCNDAHYRKLCDRIGRANVDRGTWTVSDDDRGMLEDDNGENDGTTNDDLRGWAGDLEARVGMNVDAFRVALEAYIDARNARRFARALLETLGAETFAAMVARNACEDMPEVCHSHDYCDANIVMAKACGQDECEPVTDEAVEEMMRAWAAAAPMIGKAAA